MNAAQLTLDGREEAVGSPRRWAPGGHQAAVLADAVRRGGLVSPSQAGRVIHARQRSRSGRISCMGVPFAFVDGCCSYAASDGCRELKRLIGRGLVEKVGRGLYAVLEPDERV